jgi:class 3 adenylate cyclase
MELEKNEHIIQTQAMVQTNMLKGMITKNLQLITADVLFLSEYHELKNFQNSQHFKVICQDFLSFIQHKKIYDQIRFFDKTGMEIVRINNNNGHPKIVPKEKLQSKAHRYYFKDVILMPQGAIFLSPFDLNIEHKKIEKPLKPIIRIGTPVFDNQGHRSGVVLVNYLGAQLLKDLEKTSTHVMEKIMLVNADGFWLKGLKPEDEWGFMFKERQARRFQNRFPNEWQQISNTEIGQFESAKGLFTFVTVYPNLEIKRIINTAYSSIDLKKHWKLISYISTENMWEASKHFMHRLMAIYIMFIVLTGIGAWQLSQMSLRKKLAEQDIKKQFISYARFVPREFLSLLNKKHFSEIELGNQIQQNMTIFFSDIRSYTKLSESLSPKETFLFLNSYFGEINPSIQKYNGFIDKMIGDAIMALFPGNPQDALLAVIDMKHQLSIYNQGRKEKGLEPICAGFGLHYGEVTLGTIGIPKRMDTTVVGDAVNIASRIESLTKSFKINIMLSGSVYKKLSQPNNFHLREIDTVRVKGKQETVVIYEVYDTNAPDIIEKKNQTLSRFKQALAHYRSGEFNEAIIFFQQCQAKCPEDNVPTIYIRRCNTLLRVPPGANWAGVSAL